MDNTEELFDVCDSDDNVIGQAPRSVVHARKLLHRAVHIFVFNTRGELLLHQRSAAKDEYPLCYTSSASGHLSAGEDYTPAAVRELAEELGLHSPLEYLAKFPAGPETAHEHTVLYRTVTDAPPVPNADEIAAVSFRTLDDAVGLLDARPNDFSPPFRVLLRWYHAHVGRTSKSAHLTGS
jgi:16S rRNA (adenine1518-N6/adenine1519-N6)-dimethyltransferase